MIQNKPFNLFIVLVWGFLQTAQAQVSVRQLPAAEGPHISEDYKVRVRPLSGCCWQQVPVLRCDVNTRHVQPSAFAEFDMAGPVVVQVVRDRGQSFDEVRIRPTTRHIRPRVLKNDTVEFTLNRPEYLSIEFDNDRYHNLHLLCNEIATVVQPNGDGLEAWGIAALNEDERSRIMNWEGIQSQDIFIRHPSMIYFGPGIHKPKDLPSADIHIPSNTIVYLAPGAVVKARLIVDHAENVRIIGRGIVDHPLRGVEITYSKNVLVDGLTFLNPAHYTIFGGESSELTIRNIKTFSARPWSDGIDLMCCRRVKVDNCFLRTSDDCIALYNHRWWYWGGSEDIDVSHCVFWPDVAHSVNIGSHGDDRNPKGEMLRNVSIRECDVLFNDGAGILAVNCGDNNHIHDIRFSQIYAEGIRRGRLFDLRIFQSEKYNRAPGCCIENVDFSDITISPEVPDSCLQPSRVAGCEGHPIGRYTLNRVSHPEVVDTLF